MELTKADKELLDKKGISEDKLQSQIEAFRKGFPYLRIEKPATIGDGIHRLSENDIGDYIQHYNNQKESLKIEKFVPASGAASRMFKALFEYVHRNKNQQQSEEDHTIKTLIQNIENFAFYDRLQELAKKDGYTVETLIEQKEFVELVEYIIGEQ
jgi:hypothetical protein